jgi:hypothetical protein
MELLLKSFYGHLEDGTHWEKRLEKIIFEMEGDLILEIPKNYFFFKSKLLLIVYVDDFTLSGSSGEHASFWKRLREPEAGLGCILGRNHEIRLTNNKECLAFPMQDYAG